MSAFDRGHSTRWRLIYDQLLLPANVGDEITYDRIAELLALNATKDRASIRVALRRATDEYAENKGHALAPVRGVGYRVVEASGHLKLARGQQSRASKALERGHRLATQVDLSDADPQVRQALDMVAAAFVMQMDFNRRLDVRQQGLEEALKATARRQERTDDEVAVLQARLRAVEERLGH